MTYADVRRLGGALVGALMTLASGAALAQPLYPQAEPPEASQAAPDPWEAKLPTDRPGFADTSYTLGAFDFAAEIGLSLSRPAGARFSGDLGVSARYGVFEGMELRLRIPSFNFQSREVDTVNGVKQYQFDANIASMDLGAKIAFDLHDRVHLAVLPHLIVPTLAPESGGSYAGVGGALSVITDVTLSDVLGLTIFVTPKLVQLPLATGGAEAAFVLEGSLMGTATLTRQISLFVEGFGVMPGHGEAYPGMDFGLTYHITPDMMVDMFAGATFQDTLAAFGSLGFSFRL